MQFHVGTEFDLVVSEVFTPINFYVQIMDDQDKLDMLMDAMDSFYTRHPDVKLLVIPAEDLRVRQLVAVVWEDGLWHRGVVRRMKSVKQVEVDYMDYGSRTVIDKNSLYLLMPQFQQLGRQAHLARLHGIASLQKKWVRRNSTRFSVLVRANGDEEGEKVRTGGLLGTVMSISGVKVSLRLVSTESDVTELINIGDVLVHEGHAQYAGEGGAQATEVSDNSGVNHLLPVLESLGSCLADVERPLPSHLMQEVESLKQEAISLRLKIAEVEVDQDKVGLEDHLAKEKKVLINRSIGLTLRIIMRHMPVDENNEDESDESNDSDSGVGGLCAIDSLSQVEDSLSQASYSCTLDTMSQSSHV